MFTYLFMRKGLSQTKTNQTFRDHLIHDFLSNSTNCSLWGLEETLITSNASSNLQPFQSRDNKFYWKVILKIIFLWVIDELFKTGT